jgi:hypothetical protein
MAKPSLSDSTIRAALHERWGEISASERLAEGLDSQTYGFRHDGVEYVARVNQSSCGFHKDAFVYRASPAQLCQSLRLSTSLVLKTATPSAFLAGLQGSEFTTSLRRSFFGSSAPSEGSFPQSPGPI